jgi:hypothetical protein
VGPKESAPNRREAWEAVAERVGGRFIEAKRMGGHTVTFEHGPWTLTLGLHVVHTGSTNTVSTQVLTHFRGREPLRLTVRPRTFLDTWADKLGLGGPSIGDRALARRYVVRGRPASRVRSVLSGGLADALGGARTFRIEVGRAPRRVRTANGGHAGQLQVLAPGVDTDVERMVVMCDVARMGMDVLARIGAASAEPVR